MKIVFLDSITMGKTSLDVLKKFGELIVHEFTHPQNLHSRISDCGVIVTNKVLIDREAINHATHLKLICVTATGINNVDVEYARSKGIAVKNVVDYSTESVAQTTFASLLYVVHKINYYDRYVKDHHYEKSMSFTHHDQPFWQLKNKNFGIIGLGNIGKRVGDIAKAFGCKIYYFSTSGKNNDERYTRCHQIEDLLPIVDVLSIHAPLNENTRGLISSKQLKMMKRTSILVNMGRGGIVNEKDLAYALDHDWIAGAAIDVLENEPIQPDHPLLQIKNKDKILITPHLAWASIEARSALMEKVCLNIQEFINSEK